MAETKFESSVKTVNKPAKALFNFLSDFRNLSPYIPQDKIQNWQADEKTCHFSIPNMGDGGLEIVNAEANNFIKYTGVGKMPFNFFFWIQFKEVAPNDTKIKLTIKADLNMMMKMTLKKPLTEGIDKLADQMAMLMNGANIPG